MVPSNSVQRIAAAALVLVLLFVGAGSGQMTALGQEGTTTGSKLYLPVAISGFDPRAVVSGQVLDPANRPVSNVTISASGGKAAVTDSQGKYALPALASGTYNLSAYKKGFAFDPVGRVITIPNTSGVQNFIASPTASCYEEVVNGSFESSTGWYIPSTAYSAGYSTAQAHDGTRSMRSGIVSTSANRYSYSDFDQAVYIPSDADTAVLTFYQYSRSSVAAMAALPKPPEGNEWGLTALSGDVQYLLILNTYGNIIATPVWQRVDNSAWQLTTVNLIGYAGRVVRIHFGVYNDGADGITSMYVDTASLQICRNVSFYTISGRAATSTNTPIPNVAVTTNTGASAVTASDGTYTIPNLVAGTYTITPSATGYSFTPTNRSVTIAAANVTGQDFVGTLAATCTNIISNGGFEVPSGWDIPLTAYSAGYSTAQVHGGSYSLRTGIIASADNRYSYSSGTQQVSIPSNALTARVGFWFWSRSTELTLTNVPSLQIMPEIDNAPLSGDVQYLLILDQNNNWIDTLLWNLLNKQAWQYVDYNLSSYTGKTISLHFGTYNDGYGGVSAMYVDDVALQVCR